MSFLGKHSEFHRSLPIRFGAGELKFLFVRLILKFVHQSIYLVIQWRPGPWRSGRWWRVAFIHWIWEGYAVERGKSCFKKDKTIRLYLRGEKKKRDRRSFHMLTLVWRAAKANRPEAFMSDEPQNSFHNKKKRRALVIHEIKGGSEEVTWWLIRKKNVNWICSPFSAGTRIWRNVGNLFPSPSSTLRRDNCRRSAPCNRHLLMSWSCKEKKFFDENYGD